MKQMNADYCLGPEKNWNADNSMGPNDETMECRQMQRTKQGYYYFFLVPCFYDNYKVEILVLVLKSRNHQCLNILKTRRL